MRTMSADLIAGLQAAIRELDIDLSDKKKGRQAGEPDGQGKRGRRQTEGETALNVQKLTLDKRDRTPL